MKTFDDFINEMAGLSNRKQTLINQIHKAVDGFTRSVYSDPNWQGKDLVLQAIKGMGLEAIIMDNQYTHDPGDQGKMPNGKLWKFEIHFTNQKGKPDTIYGQIVASGAGSVEDPLSKYDIVVMMS